MLTIRDLTNKRSFSQVAYRKLSSQSSKEIVNRRVANVLSPSLVCLRTLQREAYNFVRKHSQHFQGSVCCNRINTRQANILERLIENFTVCDVCQIVQYVYQSTNNVAQYMNAASNVYHNEFSIGLEKL